MRIASVWIVGLLVFVTVLAIALVLHRTRAGTALKQRVPDRPQRRILLANVGFVVTFAIVRGLTWSIRHDIGPFHNIELGGRHIHHMVWGILLLLLIGFGWLCEFGCGKVGSSTFVARLMSLSYGAAAALTLDEFALWLNLEDVYWSGEGRESVDAVMMFFGVCVIAYIVARAKGMPKGAT
jgi:hypothetical protein